MLSTLMRLYSPLKFIKNRLAGTWPAIYDSTVENADGCAESRRGMLFGNFFGGAASTLISGLYFTGLLLAMNASDKYIGYITVAITACGFVQMFSPMFFERLKRRKPVLMALRITYYFINIFVLGAIPILPLAAGPKLGLFMAAVILMNLVTSFSGPGFSIWHMQNVPDEKRARFFSLSSVGGTVINTLTTFCAGLIVDGFEGNSASFFGISPTISAILLLRAMALVLAVFEWRFFFKIKEHPYAADPDAKNSRGLRLLLLPLRDRAFLGMVVICVLWTFSTAVIGPYYTVYLLNDVKVSYAFLSFVGVFSIPLTIIMTPVWAGVINRLSWLRTLSLSLLLYSFAYVGNVFVTSGSVILYLFIVIWCNLIAPGNNLVFSNLPYLKMPQTSRTAYLSFYTTCSSLASMLGAYAGTQIISATDGLSLSLFGFKMINKQYINLLQFVLIVLLSVYVWFAWRRTRAEKAN